MSPFYDWETNAWYMRTGPGAYDPDKNTPLSKSPIIIGAMEGDIPQEGPSHAELDRYRVSMVPIDHVLHRAMVQARGGDIFRSIDGEKTCFPYTVKGVRIQQFGIQDFDFRGAQFDSCIFIGIHFRQCDFRSSSFVRCFMPGCVFTGCDFSKSFHAVESGGRITLNACGVPSSSHQMIATLLDQWILNNRGEKEHISMMRALAHKVRSNERCWYGFTQSLRNSSKEFRQEILMAIGRSVNIPSNFSMDQEWAEEIVEYYRRYRMHFGDDYSYVENSGGRLPYTGSSVWNEIHERRRADAFPSVKHDALPDSL